MTIRKFEWDGKEFMTVSRATISMLAATTLVAF
jgi:hypothetical protein